LWVFMLMVIFSCFVAPLPTPQTSQGRARLEKKKGKKQYVLLRPAKLSAGTMNTTTL